MNSFFRICIYLCMALIVFTLVVNFVEAVGNFGVTTDFGTDVDESNALSQISGFSGGMENLWLVITLTGGLASIGLVFISKSLSPLAVYAFSTVFWTSWIRMHNILTAGNYLPSELFIIFWVVVLFLFIAAAIGLISGGG
jgi:hypothetical protein